jgi:hypothetical protein
MRPLPRFLAVFARSDTDERRQYGDFFAARGHSLSALAAIQVLDSQRFVTGHEYAALCWDRYD